MSADDRSLARKFAELDPEYAPDADDIPYECGRCAAVVRPSDGHDESAFCYGVTDDEIEEAFRGR